MLNTASLTQLRAGISWPPMQALQHRPASIAMHRCASRRPDRPDASRSARRDSARSANTPPSPRKRCQCGNRGRCGHVAGREEQCALHATKAARRSSTRVMGRVMTADQVRGAGAAHTDPALLRRATSAGSSASAKIVGCAERHHRPGRRKMTSVPQRCRRCGARAAATYTQAVEVSAEMSLWCAHEGVTRPRFHRSTGCASGAAENPSVSSSINIRRHEVKARVASPAGTLALQTRWRDAAREARIGRCRPSKPRSLPRLRKFPTRGCSPGCRHDSLSQRARRRLALITRSSLKIASVANAAPAGERMPV